LVDPRGASEENAKAAETTLADYEDGTFDKVDRKLNVMGLWIPNLT